MQCRFMLSEQISRGRCSAIPGLHSLPAPFPFLLPVSWGGGSAWVPLDHGFGALPCSMRSVLFSRCMQSGAAFFPVALSGLVVLNYIFVLYVVLGGLCLTSHAAIFNSSAINLMRPFLPASLPTLCTCPTLLKFWLVGIPNLHFLICSHWPQVATEHLECG